MRDPCRALWVGFVAAALSTAPGQHVSAADATSSVRLAGVVQVSDAGQPNFGGISAIDRDSRSGQWWLLSDDKSEASPSRFYPVKLKFDKAQLVDLTVGGARYIQAPKGGTYGVGEADPEAFRVDGCGEFVWASERTNGSDRPSVRRMDEKGSDRGELPLPSSLSAQDSRGPLKNNSLEGLTFAGACDRLWLGMEGPLGSDGPPASATDGALVRMTLVDQVGREQRQFAYPLDPIRAHTGETPFDNGVSEILYVDGERLLVLERSGTHKPNPSGQGQVWQFHCRLYLVTLTGASETKGLATLRDASVAVASKLLLFDFDTANLFANLEGMAWSTPVADGKPLLILVSDNGFDPTPTLVLALDLPRDIACGRDAVSRCVEGDKGGDGT